MKQEKTHIELRDYGVLITQQPPSGGSETGKVTTKAAIIVDHLLCASDSSKHITYIYSLNPYHNSVCTHVQQRRRGLRNLLNFPLLRGKQWI